jgi:hypothetical protein
MSRAINVTSSVSTIWETTASVHPPDELQKDTAFDW